MAYKRDDADSVDIAALKILHLVFEHQSFSIAAEKLHTNQSTVSYSIDRLRKVFGDKLFVRQRGGIVPTERCKEVIETTGALLQRFQALIEPTRFEPLKADAVFTISTNYYERLVLLPRLTAELRKKTPGLRVEFIQSSAQGKIQLKRGECDLLISPVSIDDQGTFKRRLFDDKYVCVMHKSNPLARQRLSLEDYAKAPHATVTYGDGWRSFYMRELDRLGITLNSAISVPSPSNLANVLRDTDLVTTIPNRIAASYPEDFVVRDCPCPAPFETSLYWTTLHNASPMHQWIRELIVGISPQSKNAASKTRRH